MDLPRDRALGALLLLISIIVIIVYGYLLFMTEYDLILIKITMYIIVVVVFGIVGWIGYTLATTPPPKPIEEIEKELREELGKEESQ